MVKRKTKIKIGDDDDGDDGVDDDGVDDDGVHMCITECGLSSCLLFLSPHPLFTLPHLPLSKCFEPTFEKA